MAAGTITLDPQSRFQTTAVLANQSDLTFKYNTGPRYNTSILGAEFSKERVSIDTDTGSNEEFVCR